MAACQSQKLGASGRYRREPLACVTHTPPKSQCPTSGVSSFQEFASPGQFRDTPQSEVPERSGALPLAAWGPPKLLCNNETGRVQQPSIAEAELQSQRSLTTSSSSLLLTHSSLEISCSSGWLEQVMVLPWVITLPWQLSPDFTNTTLPSSRATQKYWSSKVLKVMSQATR